MLVLRKKLFCDTLRLCKPNGEIFNAGRTLSSTSFLKSKFSLPEQFRGSEDNVWVEFIKLSEKYKPLKLDLGYPDFLPPDHIRNALIEAINSPEPNMQQYTRSFGHPRLVKALSKLYSKLLSRNIDPLTEIMVSVGAQQALSSAILGFVQAGDEVVIIEPFYDAYVPLVRAAGGIPVYVPLRNKKSGGEISSADWVLQEDELKNAFNEKTKMIIINTPHNPLGKVLSLGELELIADLCKKWNVLCLSDEVYEWLVYKPNKHIRIASLPGMWDRTVTVGSAGKTFNVTGWKIGWAYGPAALINNLQVVHQNCVYTCSTPLQEAVAKGFETEMERLESSDCFFNSLNTQLERKRRLLADVIKDAGMNPIFPEGGYFIVSDWEPLEKKINLDQETGAYKDYRFAKWMTKNVGIQGIPPSAFYSNQHKALGENYIRLCYIKKDENIEKAAELFKTMKASL